MNNTQLTWHTESRKVDSLLPHKKSPRKISKEQAERLKKSLENYGLVENGVIELYGSILAGRQRMKALQLMRQGDTMVEHRVHNVKVTNEEKEPTLKGNNPRHGQWKQNPLKWLDLNLL